MKQKSLRQVAKELGVSASYLSQVNHGKRPASAKVAKVLSKNVKQTQECRGAESNCRHADFQSAALPPELPRPTRALKHHEIS